MPRAKFLAVLNPAAGGGRCERRAAPYLEKLRQAGVEIEVRTTEGPGHGSAIVAEGLRDGYRQFIAIGGDGTSYEVVNGIFSAPPVDAERVEVVDTKRVGIGFLPLGTGNSFVRDFHSDCAAYGLQSIIAGRRRPCDVMRLTHGTGVVHALGIVAFGFPAHVAALVNRRLKPLGEIGYALGVLAKLALLRHTHLPYQTETGAAHTEPFTLLCICNNRYVGGRMKMAPNADIADGEADMIRAEKVGRLDLLRTFPRIFAGTHLAHPAVSESRLQRVDFEADAKLEIMIDGEVLTLKPRSIKVLPSAVDVFV